MAPLSLPFPLLAVAAVAAVALVADGSGCTEAWSLSSPPPPRSRGNERSIVRSVRRRLGLPFRLPPDVRGDDDDSEADCEDYDDEYGDSYFIDAALRQAERARRKNEVPIGAVVVVRERQIQRQQQRRRTRRWWLLGGRKGSGSDDDDHPHRPTSSGRSRYRVLSSAHNLVEARWDASAHAELLALRRAGRRIRNWRLGTASSSSSSGAADPTSTTTTTLYTTVEPCWMCWSAAHAFRVNRIVYGAPDLRLGAITTATAAADVAAAATSENSNNHDNGGTTTNCSSPSSSSTDNNSAALLWRHPFHAIDEVRGGLEEDRCAGLLRDFFRRRRRQKR